MSLVLLLNLYEIIADTTGAGNRLVDVEDLSEYVLKLLKTQCSKLTILFEEDIILE